jgi:hypothetical protein
MDKAALPDGWTRSGEAKFFDKDTLFDLVDGEAEAYFPYGFKAAAAANYIRKGDGAKETAKEANVEVYKMGSLLDAYGIYSTMREADSKPVDVGTEGFGGTTQIMFYAGRYFVKAQVYSAAAKGRLLSFAKAVAAELPRDKKQPAELALVAIPHLVPRSDQYIGESLLGYAYWPKGLIAQIQTKDVSARVFVVITNSPADAAAALDKYVQEVVGRGTKIKSVDDGGQKILALSDRMQEGVAVGQAGKYLIGAADLKDPEKAGLPLLRQLRRQVLPPAKPKSAPSGRAAGPRAR